MIKKLIKKLAVKFLSKEEIRDIIHVDDKKFFANVILTTFEIENNLYRIIENIIKETNKERKNENVHAYRMCINSIIQNQYSPKDTKWLEVFYTAILQLNKKIIEDAAMIKDSEEEPTKRLQFIYTTLKDTYFPEIKEEK